MRKVSANNLDNIKLWCHNCKEVQSRFSPYICNSENFVKSISCSYSRHVLTKKYGHRSQKLCFIKFQFVSRNFGYFLLISVYPDCVTHENRQLFAKIAAFSGKIAKLAISIWQRFSQHVNKCCSTLTRARSKSCSTTIKLSSTHSGSHSKTESQAITISIKNEIGNRKRSKLHLWKNPKHGRSQEKRRKCSILFDGKNSHNGRIEEEWRRCSKLHQGQSPHHGGFETERIRNLWKNSNYGRPQRKKR